MWNRNTYTPKHVYIYIYAYAHRGARISVSIIPFRHYPWVGATLVRVLPHALFPESWISGLQSWPALRTFSNYRFFCRRFEIKDGILMRMLRGDLFGDTRLPRASTCLRPALLLSKEELVKGVERLKGTAKGIDLAAFIAEYRTLNASSISNL